MLTSQTPFKGTTASIFSYRYPNHREQCGLFQLVDLSKSDSFVK